MSYNCALIKQALSLWSKQRFNKAGTQFLFTNIYFIKLYYFSNLLGEQETAVLVGQPTLTIQHFSMKPTTSETISYLFPLKTDL